MAPRRYLAAPAPPPPPVRYGAPPSPACALTGQCDAPSAIQAGSTGSMAFDWLSPPRLPAAVESDSDRRGRPTRASSVAAFSGPTSPTSRPAAPHALGSARGQTVG